MGVIDDEGNTGRAAEEAERVDEHQGEDEHHVMPEAGGMTDSIKGGIVGGGLDEMASQHKQDGYHHGHERSGHHGIEEVCQVINVGDDEAHGDYAQEEQ